jgi:hypothetical protein
MPRRLFVPILLLLLMTAPALAGERDSRSTTHRVDLAEKVKPGQRLDIDLETGGSLAIEAWDRNEVRVESDHEESDCPGARIRFSPTSTGVLLESDYESESGNYTCSLSFTIMVPRRFDIHVVSAGGELRVADVRGRLDGRTGGGNLELVGVRGTVRLRIGGGEIAARDCDMDGTLSTGGGAVRFENVVGEVVATSGSLARPVRGQPRRR